ncbi:MAG: hypothetical protein LBS08_05255 [Candidatus Symbiothrix sp.]|jgi:alpha-acetolactate decarboxylase|nr:hypothetical protein [Candidatus Symbiothrix sp.]
MNKKILKYGFLLLICALTGCMEKVEIEIPEDYDAALITGVNVYRASKEGDSEFVKGDPVKPLTSTVEIDNEMKTVITRLTTEEDLTKLKVSLTISSGATIINSFGGQIQDFSQVRTVEIESPSKKVKNTWTIEIISQ